MLSPVARSYAQAAAIARTQAELALIGLAAPAVLSGDGREAAAHQRMITIGHCFEPHEIPGVLRHEAGHFNNQGVQLLMQRLGVAGRFRNEQQADFVCGFATAMAGDNVAPYLATLASLPTDEEHGSITQRTRAVLAGVQAALSLR